MESKVAGVWRECPNEKPKQIGEYICSGDGELWGSFWDPNDPVTQEDFGMDFDYKYHSNFKWLDSSPVAIREATQESKVAHLIQALDFRIEEVGSLTAELATAKSEYSEHIRHYQSLLQGMADEIAKTKEQRDRLLAVIKDVMDQSDRLEDVQLTYLFETFVAIEQGGTK